MPAEEYSPLQQLLLEPGLTSVKTLAEICHADRAPLATALLRVFRSEGRETELLIELNSAEVNKKLFNFYFYNKDYFVDCKGDRDFYIVPGCFVGHNSDGSVYESRMWRFLTSCCFRDCS